MPRITEGQFALGGLAALALWLFVGLPLLYSPAEIGTQRPVHVEQANQNNAPEPKGTRNAPFFVEVIPALKSAEERAQETEDRKEKNGADRWLVRWTAALFFATIGLFTATGVLGYFAFRQMRDMKESIGVADRAAKAAEAQGHHITASERAFVFCARIESIWTAQKAAKEGETDKIAKWSFIPIWQNSGKTPPKRARNCINHWLGINGGPLPVDFDYPDYGTAASTMIGPNAHMHGKRLDIPVETLQQMRAGNAHAYIWGWIDYDDIFANTERHRAEFCFEIEVTGNPIYKEGGFAYRMRGLFNGFDGDCYRRPAPYREPHTA